MPKRVLEEVCHVTSRDVNDTSRLTVRQYSLSFVCANFARIMPLADSTAHFKKYLIKERLFSEKRWQNLLDAKWDTIQNYGFAFGNIEQNQMPNETLFKEVIARIEGYDYDKPDTWEEVEEKDQNGNPVLVSGQPKMIRKQHLEPPWHLYRRTAFSCRLAAAWL